MRQTDTKLLAEQKPLGVIDAVSAGLDLVRKRPWTLLVPMGFDALLWFLPRLSLAPLFRPFTQEMLNAATLAADPQAIEETRQALGQFVESFNLLGFVVTVLNALTRLPSLLAVDSSDVPSPIPSLAYSRPIDSAALAFILFVPLFFLCLFAVAVYLEWIAQGARPLAVEPRGAWVVRVGRLWLRLILFALLLAAFTLFAGLLLTLAQLLIGNPAIASFLALLITVALFWLFIYFFFVPSALTVSQVGVFAALRKSILLYRAYFWSTLGLVVLSVFLDRGLALIWSGLAVTTIGVAVGIIANAYIGTSLLAASMVFYQDRLNALERLRTKARPVKK